MQEKQVLSAQFGINEDNLKRRKEFVRLGPEDQQILAEMAGWAKEIAHEVAKEFYDWQFAFAPTASFFENFASEHKLSLNSLREKLEKTQAWYLLTLFQYAQEGWGIEYFETRLHVGETHDRINLPFKWYIGAYQEFEHILRPRIRQLFK